MKLPPHISKSQPCRPAYRKFYTQLIEIFKFKVKKRLCEKGTVGRLKKFRSSSQRIGTPAIESSAADAKPLWGDPS